MQVLRLELQGIGPFAGRHAIDFAALGAGGLFLLEGPTGSGKTTLIDALVFALYGDVAGADSSKARLVSTQLPAGVEPFVELTVETARGLYRVRRVPQHERRKARGAGTTVGKAAIKLWKLGSPGDPGTLLSTSLQEATEELQRAVGLSKEQFTQTVVLPQGQFATFLRAKPEERRGVLQDIFGTEFYERCARRLAELAAEHRRGEAEARAEWDKAADGFAAVGWSDAAAREPFVDAVAAGDRSAVVALADARLGEVAADAGAADAAAERAAEASAVAGGLLRELSGRNEAIRAHAALRERRAELLRAAPEVEAGAARLAAAERAEHARRPLAAMGAARRAVEAADAEAARALGQAASGEDADLVAAEPEPSALGAEERRCRAAASALGALVELEGGLPSRAESLRRDGQLLGERRSAVAAAREALTAQRGRAAELGPQIERLQRAADDRAEALQAEGAARARCDAVERLDRLAEEFVQSTRAEQAAQATAAGASEAHLAARAAWLGSLAGTLARELVEGRGCPVCGSTEHPAPAVLPRDAPTREDVDRLERAARQAEQLLARAQTASNAKATEMADQQQAVGELTRVEAEQELAEALARRREAERAAARAAELREQLQLLVAGVEQAQDALHAEENEVAAEEGRLAGRSERLGADRRRVAEALDGHASVAARVAALTRRADRAQLLVRVLAAAADARAEAGRREAELAGVLAERGFAGPAEAQAALLEEGERSRLAAAAERHRADVAAVTTRLADPRFEGLGEAAPEDEAPARDAAEAARVALEAAQARRGGAATTLRLAGEASERLRSADAALQQASRAAEPYVAMADLAAAGSGNLANVTLPTFVLLRRFEEVVDLANSRLGAMTGGRYSLRRTDAREGRSHKLGLGLEVVDHLAGDVARDPKTLSGGETFQASLAMALGLADAVTAEAGGLELSTLFVDEGFGSLDPDALDLVMDQLTALRDGGRCVGVVSHVAEMKQRIAERVTVLPRRDGTSTLSCSTDPQPALAG